MFLIDKMVILRQMRHFETLPLDKHKILTVHLGIHSQFKFFVMAKLSSLFKFEGTAEEINVVKNTSVIKRKGGLRK